MKITNSNDPDLLGRINLYRGPVFVIFKTLLVRNTHLCRKRRCDSKCFLSLVFFNSQL